MDALQILESQILRNRETQANWERSREHREIINKHLTQHGNASLLRCYGAGNCNDLDLRELVKSFTAIELVDIDTDAMELALQRQKVNSEDGIRIVGGVDLSSGDHAPKQAAVITVSSCLYSQLLEQHLSGTEPTAALIAKFRKKHLDMLIRGTKPQGHIYFISDIVSDLTAPQLKRIPNKELNGFLSKAIEKRNFFSGTNPFAIQNQLNEDPRVDTTNLLDAWKWKLGARIFAVYGIYAQLKPS